MPNVNLKRLKSLNDVFTSVMRQIFITPANNCGGQDELTIAQRKILFVLASDGPQKMSDIARQVSVTMSGATAVVDKLVRNGSCTRQADPNDRRVILIDLSDKGRQIMAESLDMQRQCFESIMSKLSLEKQRELLESFERIHALLNEIETKGGAGESVLSAVGSKSARLHENL